MGASSLFLLDFSERKASDEDYKRENPQTKIKVQGTRLDTFMKEEGISHVDMLCMDIQGYELNALKSMGENLKRVKYIILECSLKSTYINGCSFNDINIYLDSFGFQYVCSDIYETRFPNIKLNQFGEFNALFVNEEC